SARMIRLSPPPRSVGARTSTRSSAGVGAGCSNCDSGMVAPSPIATVRLGRCPSQDTMITRERFADPEAIASQPEFATCRLVRPAPLLDDRDGPPEFAIALEITQQDHGIREVAGIHRRLHPSSDQAMLGHDQKSIDTL